MQESKRKFIRNVALTGMAFPLVKSAWSNPIHEEEIIPIQSIKPVKLKRGDTVAISSPAGAVWDDELVKEFTAILEGIGFKVVYGKTLTEKEGYLAGSDELRAKELNDFFADQSVKAIFCAKGGWGCARILPLLNYDMIQKNPKVIMGFSDITSLLIGIYAKTGLVTFHGPVGNSSWGDFSMTYVKKVLMSSAPVVCEHPVSGDEKFTTITSGQTKGILIGGNLSVVTSILGSEYVPVWKNKILFLEETGEEPYRLDRMLTQLKLCGVLDSISGFIFGKCSKCEAEEPEKAFTYQQVLEQHIKPLKIPAFYNSMIGHVRDKFTLPLGIEATMDADKGMICLNESAVS